MYIRQRWNDDRLADANITDNDGLLITAKFDELWVPDLFIKNDKVSKKSDVTTLNVYARVDATGNIVYSQRITSTIACPMMLKRYPFDVQKCSLLLESCKYFPYPRSSASRNGRRMQQE